MDLVLTPDQIKVILEWPEFADVKEELADPRYLESFHDNSSGYKFGCRGPLCRKANRDRGRERLAREAQRRGEEWEPPAFSNPARYDDIYEAILHWHKERLMEGRRLRGEAS